MLVFLLTIGFRLRHFGFPIHFLYCPTLLDRHQHNIVHIFHQQCTLQQRVLLTKVVRTKPQEYLLVSLLFSLGKEMHIQHSLSVQMQTTILQLQMYHLSCIQIHDLQCGQHPVFLLSARQNRRPPLFLYLSFHRIYRSHLPSCLLLYLLTKKSKEEE